MKRRPVFNRSAVVVLLFVLAGCGSNRSPYPEAKVKSPLGRPSTCAFCKKVIALVEKDNLVTAKGVEYTVCDEKCATDLEQWAQYQ